VSKMFTEVVFARLNCPHVSSLKLLNEKVVVEFKFGLYRSNLGSRDTLGTD
jgi:hypothetical protein